MKGLEQDKNGYLARTGAVLLSLTVLLVGVLYYGLYRQHALPPLFEWLAIMLPVAHSPMEPGWFAQSVPSLTHALATMLLLHALLPSQAASRTRWRVLVVASLLAFEGLGATPDLADVIAILAGVMLAELVAWRSGLLRHALPCSKRWALTALVCLSGFMSAATSYNRYDYNECAVFSEEGICEEYKKPARPVYMSYQALRESFSVEAARSPDQLGRLYLYQDYIFLNERNQGLHVIDNSNPETPVNVGFLRIPGNTEVAIRDGFLYADSYVDLITLDLNDPTNIQLVSRQEDIFPFDAFQNIPYNISLSSYDTDAANGVIIGYRLTDN